MKAKLNVWVVSPVTTAFARYIMYNKLPLVRSDSAARNSILVDFQTYPVLVTYIYRLGTK